MRRILAGLVLALFVASPVLGAKPLSGGIDPFAWVQSESDIAAVVESQSGDIFCPVNGSLPCVINTTTCYWDIDDRFVVGSTDSILTGEATRSECLIADNAHHITGVLVGSPSPDLTVTITYEPQGVTFTLLPRLGDRAYEYRGCVVGPIHNSTDALVKPVSNGWGVPTTITVRIVAPARVRRTSATWVFGSSGSHPYRESFCVGTQTPWFDAGGATWKTGL